MGEILSLLLLALPTILVVAARLALRARPRWEHTAVLAVVGATWGLALWFWSRYAVEQTDVGLMVEGILAMATSVSALTATIVAIVMGLRR